MSLSFGSRYDGTTAQQSEQSPRENFPRLVLQYLERAVGSCCSILYRNFVLDFDRFRRFSIEDTRLCTNMAQCDHADSTPADEQHMKAHRVSAVPWMGSSRSSKSRPEAATLGCTTIRAAFHWLNGAPPPALCMSVHEGRCPSARFLVSAVNLVPVILCEILAHNHLNFGIQIQAP